MRSLHTPRLIQRAVQRLRTSIQRSIEFSRPNARLIGAVAVIGMPLYGYVWTVLYPQPYENLALRFALAAWFVPLFYVPRWGDQHPRVLMAYWTTCLIMLPTFFVFMFLMNDMNEVWALSLMASIILLILVANDALLTVLTFTVAIGLAWALHLEAAAETQSLSAFGMYAWIFGFALVGGSFFVHLAEQAERRKLDAMAAVGANIAHELRTPLLGIRSGAHGVSNYLPVLLDGYRAARDAGLPVRPIRTSHLQALDSAIERILSETRYSNLVIDMLLSSSRDHIDLEELTNMSMVETVRHAVARYPFRSDREQRRVRLELAQDFRFSGNELLVVHVIFNLLKNALFYAAKSDGHVTLRTGGSGARGILEVRDTGPGIAPAALPRIFDRFYSSQGPGRMAGNGSGIGLAFCRMVVNQLSGTISCDSVAGEGTVFTVSLPRLPRADTLATPAVEHVS